MNAPAGIRETKTNMTSKGQVLIPKEIRDRVGLIPGKPVRVRINDRGEAVVLPATIDGEDEAARRARIRADIMSVVGLINTGKTTDEMMIELRGDDPFI
jgi:AbrB family looped-hinge helix DNA binding protein